MDELNRRDRPGRRLAREALATGLFCAGAPVAALAAVHALDLGAVSPAGALAVVAAALVAGAYVYGRIARMARSVDIAAAAIERFGRARVPPRLPRSGDGVVARLFTAVEVAAFDLDALISRIETAAAVDALTGLPNRDGARRIVTAEIGRVRRRSEPLTVAVIDLDNFEALLRAHGPEGVDRLLRLTADALGRHLRAYDRLARWDSASFLAILPGADAEAAAEVIRRVRDRVEAALYDSAGEGATVSAALAALDRTDVGAGPVLVRAETSLAALRLGGGSRFLAA